MAASHANDLELTQPKGVILRRIFALARPYRGMLAGGAAIGILIASLHLVQPYVIGSSITATLQAFAGRPWSWDAARPLVWRVGVIVGLAAVTVALQYGNAMLMVHLRMRILTDLRRKIYRKILRQSFSYFDRQDTGQLINRTIGDVNMLRMFYTMLLVRGSEIVFFVVGASAFLVALDAWVAAVALPFIPVYAAAMLVFSRRIHPMFHEMRHELDRSTQILSENVQGAQVVRSFGRESEEAARYTASVRAVLARWLGLARQFAAYQPGIFLLGHAGLLLMVAMTTVRVMDGFIQVGLIYTVFQWSGMLTENMRQIARMSATLEHSLVSAERVFEILDAPPQVSTPDEPEPLPEGRGRVVFDHVTFGYNDDVVLEDVTLDIPPGTNVALVGPTGSGKTTLTKLLPRFYDPRSGRILIDGVDIRRLDLDALRAEIGFVFQDTFLFSASLADNIAFGVPEAERLAIQDAGRRAQVDEFASQFAEGYDTAVGERGISLSGGQRQRVAIARALLTDPRILILDDATASVDAATERAIQDGMAEVMHGRTTFIIAHRVSTVKRADLVLVMEGGRVVQQGTHKGLLEQDGPYRRFVQMQWRLGTDDEEARP
jgi:ATP-binding cassette subfamily B protein